jgi:hypothetical protein
MYKERPEGQEASSGDFARRKSSMSSRKIWVLYEAEVDEKYPEYQKNHFVW